MPTDFLKTPVQTKPSEYNFDKFLIEGKDFIIIKETNFERIRNQIKANQSKIIIFQASTDEELNRKVLEKIKINIYLSPETNQEKDRLKQRSSGLNQVLCKIAKQNKITIGINLSKINNSKILARIKQNIKLCRKSKTRIVVGTFAKNQDELRDAKDIESLFISLGMSTHQIKELFY